MEFIELLLEMQNEECRMQNECIFFENDFNQSAKPTPLFYILHSAFCIAQPKLRGKLQFTFLFFPEIVAMDTAGFA